MENNVDKVEDNEQHFTGESSLAGPQPKRELEREPSLDAYQRMRTRLGLGEQPKHFLPGTPIETLVQALSHSDPRMRAEAARTLGATNEQALAAWGKSTLVKHIQKAFYDCEWEVRIAVVEALKNVNDKITIPMLIIALDHDESDLVKSAAARALGELGEHAPTYPLIAALRTSGWRVKVAVLQAMRNPGIFIPLDDVKTALHDSDISVRIEAVQTLGAIQGKAAIDYLVSTAQADHEWLVREAAVLTLERLGELKLSSTLRAALDSFQEESETISEEAPLTISAQQHEQVPTKFPMLELDALFPLIPMKDSSLGVLIPSHSNGNIIPIDSPWEILKETCATNHTIPLQGSANKEKKQRDTCRKLCNAVRSSLTTILLWLCALISRAQKVFARRSIRHFMKQFLSRYNKGLAVLICAILLIYGGCFLFSNPSHASPPKPNATLSLSMHQTHPIKVYPGEAFDVQLEAYNTGQTDWSPQEGYELACPRSGLTECMGVQIVPIASATMLKESHYSFRLRLQAPRTPGVYYLAWSMENHEGTFGQPYFLEVHVLSSTHSSIISGSEFTIPLIRLPIKSQGESNQLPIQKREEHHSSGRKDQIVK